MDINGIIRKIDEFLEKTGKESTDPVEANEILEKAGLLSDSNTRRGKPFRDLLRKGLIPHAYQNGGKGSSWVIPHSRRSGTNNAISSVLVTIRRTISSEVNRGKNEKSDLSLFNNIEKLRNAGFEGFFPIASLLSNTNKLPAQRGVYLVIYNSTKEPTFRSKGTGGFFKGKDPNVPIPELTENWVSGSKVIYIGKAGGSDSSATLKSRLTQYLRFGNGEDVGHYGGRYIWQMESPGTLLLAWKPTTTLEPREVEAKLIKMFNEAYGKRPFANLKD
jgi:hypothetical protein